MVSTSLALTKAHATSNSKPLNRPPQSSIPSPPTTSINSQRTDCQLNINKEKQTHEVSGLKHMATVKTAKLPKKPMYMMFSQPSFWYFSPGLTPNSQPVGGSYSGPWEARRRGVVDNVLVCVVCRRARSVTLGRMLGILFSVDIWRGYWFVPGFFPAPIDFGWGLL